MLFRQFPIHYRRPAKTPIQLFLTRDQLLVSCCLRFSRQAMTCRPGSSDRTYAELVTEGIRTFWEGYYWLPLAGGPQPLTIRVQISTCSGRRAVPIRIRHLLIMPAHVRSPLYRFYWGIIRNRHLESIGTNWSREQPGIMVLPHMDDPALVMRLAAHEAGHLFGIGDAYGAIYRFYDAAPGTESYMMHSNEAVQPEEVLMMLQAHVTGRMQYFPWSFSWRRFRKGFAVEIEQRRALAESRLESLSRGWNTRQRSKNKDIQRHSGSSQSEPVQSEYNATVTGSSVVSEQPPVDNENGYFS